MGGGRGPCSELPGPMTGGVVAGLVIRYNREDPSSLGAMYGAVPGEQDAVALAACDETHTATAQEAECG